MFPRKVFIFIVFHLTFGNLAAEEETAAYKLQYKHLMNPSDNIRQKEIEKQSVYIYEGMKLPDVQNAMDNQFDRIENMMFILTRLPPTASGGQNTEKDGCD